MIRRMNISVNTDKIPDNFAKYLKEEYNLKMVGIYQFLVDNPEALKKINDMIPEDDFRYRFKNNVK